MQFNEIGYRGKYIQIPPSHRLISDSNFFMLGTSYGNPNLIESIFDECEREYLASSQDFDATSPFPKLTCLDGVSNKIYTTLLYLNDFIYSNYNKTTYSEGFEFLILQKVKQKIYWAQIGWPHMFLMTSKNTFGLDHSFGQRPSNQLSAPDLPHTLLGVYNSLNFRVENSKILKNEDILFVKGQNLPSEFYHANTKVTNEQLIKTIYKSHPTTGAWLGRLSFSDFSKVADNKDHNPMAQ